MDNQDEAATVRPLTLAWVERQLEFGERVVITEVLHGGITAEMRRLIITTPGASTTGAGTRGSGTPRAGTPGSGTPRAGTPGSGTPRAGTPGGGVPSGGTPSTGTSGTGTSGSGTPGGGTRELVLRTVVGVEYADEWLIAESGALSLLAATGVPAPELVAVDSVAEHCEYPSLLMTHLPGRTVLDDDGLEARVPLLARQLVAIHALRLAEPLREYVTLTTADTVVTPKLADPTVWAAAIDVLRKPVPSYDGCFLHRDFQPGNVLFDGSGTRLTGVVDWAGACWVPTDLDVAHCSTNLALLHGPTWGLRFAEAYEQAGGTLAAAASDRQYWQLRDALAFSEDLTVVSEPWRQAGRTDLTTQAAEARLDAYVTTLMNTAT